MINVKILSRTIFIFLIIGCATAKRDWEKVESINTERAYKVFLQKHPNNYSFSSEAIARIEKFDWENVQQLDTIKGYKSFIQEHICGAFVNDARKKLAILEWEKAKKLDTADAYKQFVEVHKYFSLESVDNEFIIEARNRLVKLDSEKVQQLDTFIENLENIKKELKLLRVCICGVDINSKTLRIEIYEKGKNHKDFLPMTFIYRDNTIIRFKGISGFSPKSKVLAEEDMEAFNMNYFLAYNEIEALISFREEEGIPIIYGIELLMNGKMNILGERAITLQDCKCSTGT